MEADNLLSISQHRLPVIRKVAPPTKRRPPRRLADSSLNNDSLRSSSKRVDQRLKPDDMVFGFALGQPEGDYKLVAASGRRKPQPISKPFLLPNYKRSDNSRDLDQNENDTTTTSLNCFMLRSETPDGVSVSTARTRHRFDTCRHRSKVTAEDELLRSSLKVFQLLPTQTELELQKSGTDLHGVSSANRSMTKDTESPPRAGSDIASVSSVKSLPLASTLMLVATGTTGKQSPSYIQQQHDIRDENTMAANDASSSISESRLQRKSNTSSATSGGQLSSSFAAAMLRYGDWNRPTRRGRPLAASVVTDDDCSLNVCCLRMKLPTVDKMVLTQRPHLAITY